MERQWHELCMITETRQLECDTHFSHFQEDWIFDYAVHKKAKSLHLKKVHFEKHIRR